MVRSCFSAYSWDQCVLLKSTSPDFAEKMQQAIKSFDPKKMAHPGFVPEDVQEGEQMGYRVEMAHKFVSEQSLLEKSGLSAKELAKAIHIDEFADHRGEKQRGVLLPQGDMVVICYRDYHSSLLAAHHSSHLQVRKEQGLDVYEWLKKSLSSERKMPAPMSKSKVLQSEEELQKLIDTAIESKRSVMNQGRKFRASSSLLRMNLKRSRLKRTLRTRSSLLFQSGDQGLHVDNSLDDVFAWLLCQSCGPLRHRNVCFPLELHC